jgi:hypothetical protein
VQPCREGRFAAEGVSFAEQKQKGFLSQIFRFGRVSYYAQAYRIHTPAMQSIEEFQDGPTAVAGSLDSLRFTSPLAIGETAGAAFFGMHSLLECTSQFRLRRFSYCGPCQGPNYELSVPGVCSDLHDFFP